MNSVDISGFMSWFVSQISSMIASILNILENIQFAGTNLLQVLMTITIISVLLPIILTLNVNSGISGRVASYNERVKRNNKSEMKEANRRVE